MTKGKSLKIFIIILGVILISVIGYEIWKINKDIEKISSKTPEVVTPQKVQTQEIDTSDWKTYRNGKYGFELKYPKEWKLEGNEEKSITIYLEDRDYMPLLLSIEVIDNPNCLPLEELEEVIAYPDLLKSPELFSVKYINGKLFYDFRPPVVVSEYYGPLEGSGLRFGLFIGNKYRIRIVEGLAFRSTGFNDDYLDTLISTFKFRN